MFQTEVMPNFGRPSSKREEERSYPLKCDPNMPLRVDAIPKLALECRNAAEAVVEEGNESDAEEEDEDEADEDDATDERMEFVFLPSS